MAIGDVISTSPGAWAHWYRIAAAYSMALTRIPLGRLDGRVILGALPR